MESRSLANLRFEWDAPTAGSVACFRAPQTKRYEKKIMNQYEEGFGHALLFGIGVVTTIIVLSLIPLNLSEKIQPGLTILSLFVGFGSLIFQLNKQHKNNYELQRKQFKTKIQQEIFNEICEGINESTSALIKVQSKLFEVQQKIDSKRFLKSEGIKTKQLSERTGDFIDYHHSFSKEIIEIIYILEKYIITDRIFKIFNMALQSVSYDLEKSYLKVNDSLMKFLPIDLPEDNQKKLGVQVLEPREKTEADFENLKSDISNYNRLLMDMTCYLHDLKTEAQNILLGEIFDNPVTPRRSSDGEYVVVSKSTKRSLDEQEHYFMHETNWGKNWQAALKRTKNI
jgi:hypothetical protein